MRPGRFDRRVVVNLPDKSGREAIFKVHTRKVPLAADVDLEEIAQTTPGVSGADIRNLVNEAALLAARREQDKVHHKDFIDALEKIVLGPERPIILSEADKERVAYHEGGHAILGLVVPGADPVHRVTIVPRGQALGVTYQRPLTDRYNYPEAYLRAKIVGMLGGRAAEEVVYGTQDHGSRKRHRAGHRAGPPDGHPLGHERQARHGPACAAAEQLGRPCSLLGAKPYSEETAKLIDMEVARIIQECHEEAKRLLGEHRASLDALVAALMQRESLDEKEILEVTGLPPAPPLPDRPRMSDLTEEAAREPVTDRSVSSRGRQ